MSAYCELITFKIVDALKRGNTRRNASALANISNATFCNWMKKYPEFKARVLNAEAEAEDEGIVRIRAGSVGWQGMAWWIQRRNRNGRWAERVEAVEKAKLQAAANQNSLEDVPLDDLQRAIADAADLKAAEAAKKKETG
jgi:hypothetical protein